MFTNFLETYEFIYLYIDENKQLSIVEKEIVTALDIKFKKDERVIWDFGISKKVTKMFTLGGKTRRKRHRRHRTRRLPRTPLRTYRRAITHHTTTPPQRLTQRRRPRKPTLSFERVPAP